MEPPSTSSSATAHRSGSTRGLLGWALYDWANSPFATLIQTFVFAAYFTRQVARDETTGSAQWGTTVSIAGLMVAVGGPILGAIADQSGRRKPWVAMFTCVCLVATALLWFVKPATDYVLIGLVLLGVGTIGAEYAGIFYNAMLPALAPPEKIGRWSGWGWALGYAGGLACLVVALFAFVRADQPWLGLDRDSAEHVRATFVLVAVWFAVFTIPLMVWTPDAPGTGKSIGQAVRDGLGQLWDSIRQIRRYRIIVRFLIARMIYVDGLATTFAFGGVFAAGTFNMTEQEVLMFGIALNVTAGLGAAGFAWIDDWIGPKQTIMLSLVGLIASSAAMLLTQSQTVFWIVGMVLGIFVGPAQAASRSYMARVAPNHLRNQMFGLFAFSGKATSFLGPLLVGWISYQAGSQRIGMSTVVAFFFIGLVLMFTIPKADQAKVREAGA